MEMAQIGPWYCTSISRLPEGGGHPESTFFGFLSLCKVIMGLNEAPRQQWALPKIFGAKLFSSVPQCALVWIRTFPFWDFTLRNSGLRNYNSGLSISSSEYLMFCKQLVIPWWYPEWSWSGFRDSVICTNLIILQSWHPSGLVSSVPQCPGELFVPMLLLRLGGCALTHNYDGEYSLSKTYSHKTE